jgi:hypothetical protein
VIFFQIILNRDIYLSGGKKILKNGKLAFVLPLIFGLSILILSACSTGSSSTTSSSTPTGGGGVVNSQSLISAEIKAIRPQTSGYSWEVDILVLTSEDVGNLPNPTKDKLASVITVKTDEDMSSFKEGQTILANVKYVGDVPKPGISLYMFNIKAK